MFSFHSPDVTSYEIACLFIDLVWNCLKNSGASVVGVSFPECNFLNYVIKYRRLARFGCLVKRTKQWRNEQRSLLIKSVFLPFGKYWKVGNVYCASTPTFSSRLLIGNFESFHWSVWSWAGATSSQYGPSLLQRSELFQAQESNTYPGTKETSQQGRTTGGNCNLSAPRTLLMTPSQKRWEGGGLFVYTSFLCCASSTYSRTCLQSWGVMIWCSLAQSWFRKLQSDVQDWCQLHTD